MAENIETPETTGQSQEAQTSAGGSATAKISSMLKGLQNFSVADFVKGKPGQWQKVAVIAVIVIVIVGLGAIMMWGLALWALGNSFGDPNNCATSQSQIGLPNGATSDWRTGIYTTQFAGCADDGSSCRDPADNCLGSSGISTGCNAPTQLFAALPYSEIAGQCNGDIEKCPRIEVLNPENNKSLVLAVVDTGPCNTSDREYVLNGAEPMVRRGEGVGGCAAQRNKAELDISPTAMSQLEATDFDRLNWRFTSAVTGSSTNGCASRTDFTGPGAIYDSNAFTAEQIDNYLRTSKPNSPLNGKGAAFVASGRKHGVNPGFLLGITNAESSLGLQCSQSGNLLNGTNNAFGLTCGGQTTFCRFSNYEDGIEKAAKNATTKTYKSLDGTIREFRLRWCGYETEDEKSPVKLSNGVSITYDCKNGRSKWQDEVLSIMNGIK